MLEREEVGQTLSRGGPFDRVEGKRLVFINQNKKRLGRDAAMK